MIPTIKVQLFNMKSAEEFYVMPNEQGDIVAESDNYIGGFDKHGFGMFTEKGECPEIVVFPDQFVYDALMICPPMLPKSLKDIFPISDKTDCS